MFGVTLIIIIIITGGVIAFLGDRIGTRVGKRRMTLWGLRLTFGARITSIILMLGIASCCANFHWLLPCLVRPTDWSGQLKRPCPPIPTWSASIRKRRTTTPTWPLPVRSTARKKKWCPRPAQVCCRICRPVPTAITCAPRSINRPPRPTVTPTPGAPP